MFTRALATREKSTIFLRLHTRLPVFRDGPTLTGETTRKLFYAFAVLKDKVGSLVLSHVMDAFQNNVAHHTRDVFGVWVGLGGGVGRINYKRYSCLMLLASMSQKLWCFPQQCSTPRPRCLWCLGWVGGWGGAG